MPDVKIYLACVIVTSIIYWGSLGKDQQCKDEKGSLKKKASNHDLRLACSYDIYVTVPMEHHYERPLSVFDKYLCLIEAWPQRKIWSFFSFFK